jgi:hypothetical protein
MTIDEKIDSDIEDILESELLESIREIYTLGEDSDSEDSDGNDS